MQQENELRQKRLLGADAPRGTRFNVSSFFSERKWNALFNVTNGKCVKPCLGKIVAVPILANDQKLFL